MNEDDRYAQLNHSTVMVFTKVFAYVEFTVMCIASRVQMLIKFGMSQLCNGSVRCGVQLVMWDKGGSRDED